MTISTSLILVVSRISLVLKSLTPQMDSTLGLILMKPSLHSLISTRQPILLLDVESLATTSTCDPLLYPSKQKDHCITFIYQSWISGTCFNNMWRLLAYLPSLQNLQCRHQLFLKATMNFHQQHLSWSIFLKSYASPKNVAYRIDIHLVCDKVLIGKVSFHYIIFLRKCG